MARTPQDLTYDETGEAALFVSDDGEILLWVRDEYLAGRASEQGTYTLNDYGAGVPISPDEDIDQLIAEWERATS